LGLGLGDCTTIKATITGQPDNGRWDFTLLCCAIEHGECILLFLPLESVFAGWGSSVCCA